MCLICESCKMKKVTFIFLCIIIAVHLNSCKKKEKPVVETTGLSNITASSATSGGNVISDGDDAVVERGVCWAKNPTPTTDDNKTSNGIGIGSFSSTLENLEPGTDYYVRAYARNEAGTGYGIAVSFKTLGQVPSASASQASDLTSSSARLSGVINPNLVTTAVSFEYGTTTNYGFSVSALQSSIDGNSDVPVNADITSLLPGTTYHYRVKAVNSLGITYSNDMTFTTLGSVPSVTTPTSSAITTSTFTVSSNVNANHVNTTVTIEYGTADTYGSSVSFSQNPVTGSVNTPVSITVSSLNPGTTYHFRVKAENSVGITYSNDVAVTTLGQIPLATTRAASHLYPSATYLNGTVSANYLSTTVTFEYGTTAALGSSIPAVQSPLSGSTAAAVNATLTGLTDGTTYHFRVKAENSLGVSYGNILTFVPEAAPTTVTDIEGRVYPVVLIGTQYWMAENLKTTKYNDNTNITNVTSSSDWIALTSPAYCWYENDAATYKDTYGALYNFYAVATGKLCPSGWHVPSNDEFTLLTDYLGGADIAGGKLKETGTTHWTSPNATATNESDFTALPAGDRTFDGSFTGTGVFGVWWTSTPYNEIKPWYRSVSKDHGMVFVGNGSENYLGFSIRCIRD